MYYLTMILIKTDCWALLSTTQSNLWMFGPKVIGPFGGIMIKLSCISIPCMPGLRRFLDIWLMLEASLRYYWGAFDSRIKMSMLLELGFFVAGEMNASNPTP